MGAVKKGAPVSRFCDTLGSVSLAIDQPAKAKTSWGRT